MSALTACWDRFEEECAAGTEGARADRRFCGEGFGRVEGDGGGGGGVVPVGGV